VPTEHSPAQRTDREQFPHLKDDIGEDPARFLDRPLFDASDGQTSSAWFIAQRIGGIDRIEVCRAWKAIERRLERGPRDRIIELLNEREQRLEEIGERSDRLEPIDRESTPKEWYRIDQDGERTPWEDVDRVVGLPANGVATMGDDGDGS